MQQYTPYVNKWCDLAEYLNEWILQNGALKPNIHPIWNKFLHAYEEEDWIGILACCLLIDEDKPAIFNISQSNHLETLRRLYDDPRQAHWLERRQAKEKRTHTKSILDLPENKTHLWKFAMILRESYCKICELHIPNK